MLYNTVTVIISSLIVHCLAGDLVVHTKEDRCTTYTSCDSCISQTMCTWCVAKSLCTKQRCGNDNVIYPEQIQALMSGPDFCPRIADTTELIFASGKKEIVSVRITQIYLFMAFTPWRCKFNLNGEEFIVTGVLLADTVYCESFEMKNKSDDSYIEGSVKVLWNFNKAFDNSLPFKVCRCDLDPLCIACKDKISK